MHLSNTPMTDSDMIAARRSAMAILAEGQAQEIADLMARLGEIPPHDEIRRPENGLVMVRARVGGDGSPFNLGEASVTRAAVKLQSGEVGFGYVLGRDHTKARLVALCDALFQSAQHRPDVEQKVLEPLRSRCAAERSRTAEQVAATRVEFFTLVRGED